MDGEWVDLLHVMASGFVYGQDGHGFMAKRTMGWERMHYIPFERASLIMLFVLLFAISTEAL
jgi:hypothetical protein